MNNYIVLDIESPNTYFTSVSAIGIVVVENNKITEKIYSLINPEDTFEDEIIDMTGITPEMVKNEPTFKEFWPRIRELLIENYIIGHNITYDLNVISNSLKHYNLEVPDFRYICTLNLARTRMNLDSYSLTDIMYGLEVDYDAHNALADAEVTHYLFNYLNDIKPFNILDKKIFSNRNKNKPLPEDLYPNLNELYGSILELRYKDEITRNQIKIIEDWIIDNEEYSQYSIIKNIIINYNLLFTKENINKEDIISFSKTLTLFSKTDKYSKEEINYQILVGILKMIKCDESISKKEYAFLEKWLSYYVLPENIDENEILESLNGLLK